MVKKIRFHAQIRKVEISGDNKSADCMIYGGYAVNRILPGPTNNGDELTFKDLAKTFMEYIMNKSMAITTYVSDIHVVFEQ